MIAWCLIVVALCLVVFLAIVYWRDQKYLARFDAWVDGTGEDPRRSGR